MDRYERNKSAISQVENEILKNTRICVVGCGGLGGYIIEMLGRLGFGHITAVDSDVFDVSNLNRQLLSNESTIGKSKASAALDRMQQVNSEICLTAVHAFLDEKNGKKILAGHDLVMDALDSIGSRLILEKLCKEMNLPLVHGAIGGWYGQVTSVFPGDDTLQKLYGSDTIEGIEKSMGNPAFTPALIASIQVSEAVKIRLNRGDILRRALLFIDVLNNEFTRIDMN